MQVNAEELKQKVLALFPEIEQYGLNMDLKYDADQDAWLLTVSKGQETLSTHLEEQDVEACLTGKECYHVAMQLGRFIRHYCEGGEACTLGQ
ncbi:MAG: hypothetical protein KGY41_09875 [Desulfovermiculus sp.]|nr:hypothetical protein [Desulfovermiculus sp.]